MSDASFADTGLLTQIASDAEITRFQVVGERSSGTNFTKRLLGRNSNLRPTEALGWKHGFPHAGAIPPDLLVIGVVRRADDWALSMHARPWHCSPAMQAMPFSEFIRAEWDSRVDRARYFGGLGTSAGLGQPLQHDRHPLTGRRFANIFDLRQTKLAGLLSYQERGCNFVLLRLETITINPEATLDHILRAAGHPVRESVFRPVVKRLGTRFRPAVEGRPKTPETLTGEDLQFLKETTDSDQEKWLGYRY